MPPWLPRVLTRIRALAAAGRVVFTEKALGEITDLRLGRADATEILCSLQASDDAARQWSEPAGEWLHVFRPTVAGLRLYVKVAIRTDCVVISCHEDEPEEAEDDGNGGH